MNSLRETNTIDLKCAYYKDKPIRAAEESDKKLTWEKQDEEWYAWAVNKFWCTRFKGKPEQGFPDYLKPLVKVCMDMRDKLVSFGGEQVILVSLDTDAPNILSRGQLWYGDQIQFRTGTSSQCHRNSAAIWEKHYRKKDKEIYLVTGYALSKDGLWRQHSWCVEVNDGQSTIIETTIDRVAYFGFVMTNKEASKFYEDNL